MEKHPTSQPVMSKVEHDKDRFVQAILYCTLRASHPGLDVINDLTDTIETW